ncbi:hypothetical protein LSH36_797g01011 [Paralvinella palmiformis]|uniref:Uncharacterized protein n=1 Tax=Paralvinella palmiformis TaxID=53620 RepID=A0AAD9IZP6_9ANNE|nr:hypothetical protein LSH36_797g01011 [Paralvinella palmiformis]
MKSGETGNCWGSEDYCKCDPPPETKSNVCPRCGKKRKSHTSN